MALPVTPVKQIQLVNLNKNSSVISQTPNKSDGGSGTFVSSPNAPASFTPTKGADGKPLKPPKPPEKPLMPYMRYTREVWDQVKAKHPDLKLWEIGKIIGQMWRQLPEDNKNKYIKDYELDKVEYEKSMKEYHNSPAYLAYLAAKTKLESAPKVVPESTPASHPTPEPPPVQIKPPTKLFIEPAEDPEDLDEEYSLKHLAFARYHTSHRLMNSIFSDTVVPSEITTNGSRMDRIDRQLQTLTKFQQKLEIELKLAEEKFQAKKRKSEEMMEAFDQEMTKLQKQHPISDDQFQQMVNRHLAVLRKERATLGQTGTVVASGSKDVSNVLAGSPFVLLAPQQAKLITPIVTPSPNPNPR